MISTTRRNAPIAALATAFLLAAAFALPARSVFAGDPPPPGGKPDAPPANPPANPPMNPPGNPLANPPAAPPPAAAPKVTIDEGTQELNHLTEFLKNKKADTQDILGALDAVMKTYPNLKPNVLKDPATGAESEDTAHFDEQKNRLQTAIEKALMKALELEKVKPNNDTNERDDVNIKAAQLLASARPEVHDTLVKELETFIDKGLDAKRKQYKIPTGLYDEVFKDLGVMGTKKNGVYDYLQKNWVTGDQSGDKPDMIKAAHDGIALIKNMPGQSRYEFVKQMTTLYSGIEHNAEAYHPGATTANGAKVQNPKAFWDKIKGSVIKALQVLCKEPKEKDGALIASASKFFEWFGDNKNPKRAPWIDPEKVAEQTPPAQPANPPPSNPPPK